MARPLEALASHHHLSFLSFSTTTTATLLLLVAAVVAISSIIFSLCTTHKHSKHLSSKKSINNIERKLVSTLSDIGSRALVMAKMVSWKKGSDDDDDDADADAGDVVWKRSILMGERCRPLDLSGEIIYDVEGNMVKELPSRVIEGRIGGGGNGSGSIGRKKLDEA